MVSFKEKLDETIQYANQLGIEQTRSEWLILDVFKWSRTDFLIHMYEEMNIAEVAKFDLAVQRMLSGEPIQYIVGFQSFYGYKYKVNENCLIPRPETEEVMIHFLNQCKDGDIIADIGTGSGAIAITLKKLNQNLEVLASDLYDATLEVAKENAQALDVNIQWFQGDALKPFIKNEIKLDGLISNPPYISDEEMKLMNDTVLKYEPHVALFAENNGYAIYESILDDLPKVLKKEANVTFEIGFNQGEQLKTIINQKYPHIKVEVLKDINQLDRIVSFKWTE